MRYRRFRRRRRFKNVRSNLWPKRVTFYRRRVPKSRLTGVPGRGPGETKVVKQHIPAVIGLSGATGGWRTASFSIPFEWFNGPGKDERVGSKIYLKNLRIIMSINVSKLGHFGLNSPIWMYVYQKPTAASPDPTAGYFLATDSGGVNNVGPAHNPVFKPLQAEINGCRMLGMRRLDITDQAQMKNTEEITYATGGVGAQTGVQHGYVDGTICIDWKVPLNRREYFEFNVDTLPVNWMPISFGYMYFNKNIPAGTQLWESTLLDTTSLGQIWCYFKDD